MAIVKEDKAMHLTGSDPIIHSRFVLPLCQLLSFLSARCHLVEDITTQAYAFVMSHT